jgi:hypothetical protein
MSLSQYIDALKSLTKNNKIVRHEIKFERDVQPIIGNLGYSTMKPTGTRYIHLIIELRDEIEVADFYRERAGFYRHD